LDFGARVKEFERHSFSGKNRIPRITMVSFMKIGFMIYLVQGYTL
jgi:hypothetical protein